MSEVLSRRERPAKPALSRQVIVEAALTILRAEGLSKVTMRRVADALDTGHASLYVYVRDTEDLHAQLLDAQLAALVFPKPGDGNWRDRLVMLLRSYQGVLIQNAEIARMALSTHPNGPNSIRLVEEVLALLAEGGVTGRAAAWGMDLLLLYPTAIVAEHSAPKPADRTPVALGEQIAQLAAIDPGVYPHLALVGHELYSGRPRERSSWAFDVLLDGIVAAASRTEN